jgi:coenzyme F420 hydrogenase subunit beta
MSDQVDRLFSTVVNGGYCIGCGVCAHVARDEIVIRLDEIGRFQASRINSSPGLSRTDAHESRRIDPNVVCPFSQDAVDEDRLSKERFPDAVPDPLIGRYLNCYAGYVLESSYRRLGGSGGFGKWVLAELLRLCHVDAVIQVRAAEGKNGVHYSYAIFESFESVLQGSKSAYYPIGLHDVLATVSNEAKRYAIVGVPCFVKAIRLLQKADPVLRDRIRFCVGLICGHLKTAHYAESLAWQRGITPGNLRQVDFRVKLPDRPASRKGIRFIGDSSGQVVDQLACTEDLFGGDYNDCFFRYSACEFCDDVVAETADITIGDAWLPQYVGDSQGTSVVVTRHATLEGLLTRAAAEGRVHLDSISADDVARSQAGGLRDRREGLAVRLHLRDRSGVWRPPKRVVASLRGISRHRRRIYRLRSELSDLSHQSFLKAKAENDLEHFYTVMRPKLNEYRLLQAKRETDLVLRLINATRVRGGRWLRRLGLERKTSRLREAVRCYMAGKDLRNRHRKGAGR